MLDNGDIATELNSSNMLWSLAGNLALTHKILFGIHFEKDGLAFSPFVPEALGQTRSLENFKYRDATLNITVTGFGSEIKSFKVNGKETKPFIPANAKGVKNIEIVMADNKPAPLGVNHTPNVKAPLTPIARLEGTTLVWNPIEYIGEYIVVKDGKRVARTHSTTYDASEPGEYQVIGVSSDGVESFASQPMSTLPRVILQAPGEKTEMTSSEISYAPSGAITGFAGEGFVEVDKASGSLMVDFDAPVDGIYYLSVRYANGNGPVNTENKCAIRTLSVDGAKAGTLVMPTRGVGNWSDWGYSNVEKVRLSKGPHILSIEFRPENNNMNIATNHALIDQFRIEYIAQ